MCDCRHHIGQTLPIILAAFIALTGLLSVSLWFLIYALITWLATGAFPHLTTSTSAATALISLIVLTRMTMSAESDDYP